VFDNIKSLENNSINDSLKDLLLLCPDKISQTHYDCSLIYTTYISKCAIYTFRVLTLHTPIAFQINKKKISHICINIFRRK